MPAHDRGHYKGSYARRAAELRRAARADPGMLCWRCGLPARDGDPLEAGHLVDGDPVSPLAPEHVSCNRSAGARLRYDRFSTSRDW